jgi:hypothetical protein
MLHAGQQRIVELAAQTGRKRNAKQEVRNYREDSAVLMS